MSDWYRVTGFRWHSGVPQIEAVKVYKTTSARVWTSADRYENKVSDYHLYFETKDQARQWVRQHLLTKRQRFTDQLAAVEQVLKKFDETD